jgi:hypothetical protein
MFLIRPIYWCHPQADLIWPEGPFNFVILASIKSASFKLIPHKVQKICEI